MLEEYAREFPATKIIGSGGNINRLFRLASLKGPQRELPVERLQELYDTLQTLTVVQRMEQFKLKEDRADVIVPAAEIFLTAAEASCAQYLARRFHHRWHLARSTDERLSWFGSLDKDSSEKIHAQRIFAIGACSLTLLLCS